MRENENSEKMKKFASTVYFYLPRAYKYLRTKLHLPSISILRKMIAGYACKAGFVDGIFNFLKNESFKSDLLKM